MLRSNAKADAKQSYFGDDAPVTACDHVRQRVGDRCAVGRIDLDAFADPFVQALRAAGLRCAYRNALTRLQSDIAACRNVGACYRDRANRTNG
jgi:hypothetical protein